MTQELSPAVQILIDQLTTNPDEFFGLLGDAQDPYLVPKSRRPKFGIWTTIIEDELINVQSEIDRINVRRQTWFLTEEEKEALVDAYTAARRQRFEAEVIAMLHSKPADYGQQSAYVHGGTVSSYSSGGREVMRLDSSGNLSIGAAPQYIFTNSNS